MTELPGAKAFHRWITDTCRINKGDGGAMIEVIDGATKALERALQGWSLGRGAKIHLAITIERPAKIDDPENVP